MKNRNRVISVILIVCALLIAGGVAAWALIPSGKSPVSDVLDTDSSYDETSSDETSSTDVVESSTDIAAEETSMEESSAEASISEDTSESSAGESSSEDSSVPEEFEPTAAEKLLSEMTLYEKICQMFVVLPSSITGVYSQTQVGEATAQALASYPVGGVLLDATNMTGRDQITQMTANLQAYSKIPLFITVDEEGGRVNRLMSAVGTTWVDAMLSYADQGTETARANAYTIGSDILSCGFNLDFAPVADVWSNPQNTVIGDRAYSTDYEQAAELVAAAVQGFHDAGVACTLKHFPGHGDTSEDSHLGSAYVYKTLEEIREHELLPFKAGIDAGADCVMIGHLILTNIEDQPAPFSKKIVTDLLRSELGFEGVIITDALQMQALADHYSSGEVALMAVEAGCDMLLCPVDLSASIQALEDAVSSGEIAEERIDESVLRILTLKENMQLIGEK